MRAAEGKYWNISRCSRNNQNLLLDWIRRVFKMYRSASRHVITQMFFSCFLTSKLFFFTHDGFFHLFLKPLSCLPQRLEAGRFHFQSPLTETVQLAVNLQPVIKTQYLAITHSFAAQTRSRISPIALHAAAQLSLWEKKNRQNFKKVDKRASRSGPCHCRLYLCAERLGDPLLKHQCIFNKRFLF